MSLEGNLSLLRNVALGSHSRFYISVLRLLKTTSLKTPECYQYLWISASNVQLMVFVMVKFAYGLPE